MGEISEPNNITTKVINTLNNPNKFKKERKYWAEQSCYMYDGKTSLRIAKMIEIFQRSGERKQIGDLN